MPRPPTSLEQVISMGMLGDGYSLMKRINQNNQQIAALGNNNDRQYNVNNDYTTLKQNYCKGQERKQSNTNVEHNNSIQPNQPIHPIQPNQPIQSSHHIYKSHTNPSFSCTTTPPPKNPVSSPQKGTSSQSHQPRGPLIVPSLIPAVITIDMDTSTQQDRPLQYTHTLPSSHTPNTALIFLHLYDDDWQLAQQFIRQNGLDDKLVKGVWQRIKQSRQEVERAQAIKTASNHKESHRKLMESSNINYGESLIKGKNDSAMKPQNGFTRKPQNDQSRKPQNDSSRKPQNESGGKYISQISPNVADSSIFLSQQKPIGQYKPTHQHDQPITYSSSHCTSQSSHLPIQNYSFHGGIKDNELSTYREELQVGKWAMNGHAYTNNRMDEVYGLKTYNSKPNQVSISHQYHQNSKITADVHSTSIQPYRPTGPSYRLSENVGNHNNLVRIDQTADKSYRDKISRPTNHNNNQNNFGRTIAHTYEPTTVDKPSISLFSRQRQANQQNSRPQLSQPVQSPIKQRDTNRGLWMLSQQTQNYCEEYQVPVFKQKTVGGWKANELEISNTKRPLSSHTKNIEQSNSRQVRHYSAKKAQKNSHQTVSCTNLSQQKKNITSFNSTQTTNRSKIKKADSAKNLKKDTNSTHHSSQHNGRTEFNSVEKIGHSFSRQHQQAAKENQCPLYTPMKPQIRVYGQSRPESPSSSGHNTTRNSLQIAKDVTNRLYNEAEVKKNYLNRIRQKAKIDLKEEQEIKKCSFKPEINLISRTLACERHQDQPFFNLLIEQGKEAAKVKEEQRKQKQFQQLSKMTFTPQINPISLLLTADRPSNNILKEKSNANNQGIRPSFKPQINAVSTKLAEAQGDFQQRQKRYLTQKSTKALEKVQLQRLRQKSQYFRPRINQGYARNLGGQTVNQYLFDLSKVVKVQSPQYKPPIINSTSQALIEQMQDRQLSWIFSLLDSDQDGKISAKRICINSIEEHILEIITPILFEMEDLKATLTLSEFKEAVGNLHKSLTSLQKSTILIENSAYMIDSLVWRVQPYADW